MARIYDSVPKAHNELKKNEKLGTRLKFIMLGNEKVYVNAWFDETGTIKEFRSFIERDPESRCEGLKATCSSYKILG